MPPEALAAQRVVAEPSKKHTAERAPWPGLLRMQLETTALEVLGKKGAGSSMLLCIDTIGDAHLRRHGAP